MFTGPVNLGNPASSPIGELAEQIIELTGSRSKLTSGPLPEDDPRQRRPDITLARKKARLGAHACRSTKGCAKTIAYFEALLGGD